MAILHYTIGMPPTRNGGSVQYASDLISQEAQTEDVLVLISGDPLFRNRKAKIRKAGLRGQVRIFELLNPLTPTLIYGTGDPASQHRDMEVDYDNIKAFIEGNGISVMHIHTLMGLHSDIVRFIKQLGVRIIYTVHDFHGICLHYDFINPIGDVCRNVDASRCASCNQNQPSDMFLRLANSKLYHFLKRHGMFKVIKQPKVSRNNTSVQQTGWMKVDQKQIDAYEDLLAYYRDYFNLIDRFHFNSSQTESMFKRFVPDAVGKVMPVITGAIQDRRRSLKLNGEIVFGFVGNLNDSKGFPMLKRILTDLKAEGYGDFKLKVYGGGFTGPDPDCDAIIYQPPYRYSEISEVMYGIDCMIIPSTSYETFSLVALEALAHGCPVLVSDRVGAKDVVTAYAPDMVFDSQEALKTILCGILAHPDILVRYNERICSGRWRYSLPGHTQEMLAFYGS